jgi:hypothetical protein
MSWNERCLESIKKQRAEIEKKYGIRFGRTEIYCARCGKSCWPGRHVCEAIRLENLHKAREASIKSSPNHCAILKRFEAKIVATMLEVEVNQVRHWIQRRNVPEKYKELVLKLAEPKDMVTSPNVG